MHQEEQAIAAEIGGLNAALEQACAANDEKAAFKILQSLKSTREDHRRQVDALLKSESRLVLLERSRGSLIDLYRSNYLSLKYSLQSSFGSENFPTQAGTRRRKRCCKAYVKRA